MLFYFRISGPNLQGVPIDQWRPIWPVESIISCQKVYNSNSHDCSCSWNYHINIVGQYINLFSECKCLFFSFNCPTPEFKNDKMKHNKQWIPLVKLDATSQMLRPEVFGLCLGIEAYPITKSTCILKMHFMPETFISIDNNLQRRVRLHNIDKLSHDTVFWNLHFYMPNVIFEESLVFFFFFFFFCVWYQCLYYPYPLPQHMTFSDFQPKLK